MIRPNGLINAWIWLSIVFLTVFFSFIASNTDNPLRLSTSILQSFKAFLPQGWAFFTRNPREELIRLYEIEGGNVLHLNRGSSLLLNDLYGIKRNKRKLSIELTEIVKKIPADSWIDVTGQDLYKELGSFVVSDTIKNVIKVKLVTGEKILCRSQQVPWAWSSSVSSIPCKCVKIYIE